MPEEYDQIRETIKLYKLVADNPDLFEEELSEPGEWTIQKVLLDTGEVYITLETAKPSVGS